MNFYKRFIGDYGRDTGQLTLSEHGALNLMLDTFYATEKPLPGDRKALYRLLRAESEAEKRAVDSVLAQYWVQLPAEQAQLDGLLDILAEDERQALGQGVLDTWCTSGGFVNLRATKEIAKARLIAEKNRRTALLREQTRRTLKQVGGAS